MPEKLENLVLPEITPAKDEEILAYLRHSCQIADLAVAAEQEALILKICEQLNLTVSEAELQEAGDVFRQEKKLWGTSETFDWLAQQRIRVEDWSEGIRRSLLKQKLKEHLFLEYLDADYITNRENYRRVALSQILVKEQPEAIKIVRELREGNASFCRLALEHSQGRQSRTNAGFVGTVFLKELMPEITAALPGAKEGEIIGPIHTKIGFHILRVEKWFPAQLDREIRDQILEYLFLSWLKLKDEA